MLRIIRLKSGPQPDDYTPMPIFNSVFKGNKGHLDSWITYVKTDAVKSMFTKQNTQHAGGYAHQITIQDFQALFNKEGSGVDVSVGNAVLEWIKTNKMYPGELGTGVYSKSQLKYMDNIKDALAKGQSVTLSSYKFPAASSDGSGHSGGESMSKGMVGGHAYSVLSVKSGTTNDPTTDPGSGKFNWIQVRNPWGSYGREYDFSQVLPDDAAKAVKEGNGIFHLELSDLTKYFSSVDFSG
ncbi:MAG: C2 family cysteine protease [Anaerolineae bacterium]|nr:C2 family cysteine protease [Anaerolineae bacterium]